MRNTFARQGEGMLARGLLVALAVVAAVLCGGCATASPPAMPPPDPRVGALQSQVDGLQSLLGQGYLSVQAEPTRKVLNGTYMGLIEGGSVAGSAAPVLRVDLVSDEDMPHTDSHIWNKHALVQSVTVDPDAHIAVTNDTSMYFVLSAAELAQHVKRNDPYLTGGPYYVLLRDGSVTAMWPVPFP